MVTCRYVGGDCSTVGDREFDTVGQVAMFSEEGFREAILGNAPFLTDEDFARVGFTPQELTKYGRSGDRVDPAASFAMKLAMAQGLFAGLRARFARNEPVYVSD